jgi:tricorn protease
MNAPHRVRPTCDAWRLLLLALSLALAGTAAAPIVGRTALAAPLKFMRDPHIAHGLIVFAYQSDIWIAAADGANPRRLTAHPANDWSPRFSPDGQQVAFSSDRTGNADVFVVPVTGGEPRQITFFTGADEVRYWTPDGRGILMTTARSSHPFRSPFYVVPIDGGIPTPMGMDAARAGMIRQDGKLVVFTRENKGESRKGYRGNNSADLYVLDLGTQRITQLTDPSLDTFREHVQDGHPMWGADGLIYFVSERSGIYNLWRMRPDGRGAAPVTTFRSGGVKWPSMSPDGRTLIFTQDYELYTLDVPNGQPRRIPLLASVDPTDNRWEIVPSENRADTFAPSPDGSMLAVDVRGEIFLVPADAEVGEKIQVTRSARRDRYQQVSPDGKLVAYISDESGEEEIWVYDIAAGTRRQLSRHESYKTSFTWAPDASRIAFAAANRLFEIDVAAGRQRELAYNVAGGFTLEEYAADGQWLVYTRNDADLNSDVYLYDLAGSREYNVTQNPFRDSGGALTADGRTLVFSSSRAAGVNHLYAVSLVALTEDPDDPLVRARRPPTAERPADAAQTTGQAADARPVRVDPDGIAKRARPLTSGSNAAGRFFLSRDGRAVYFTATDNDGAGLFAVGLDGRERRRVAAGEFGALTPTRDRRFVFYRQTSGSGAGDLFRMPISGMRPTRVVFSLRVQVDRTAEWAQIFDESWRVMKYRFYDEQMHGKDWAAIRRQYEPMLRDVGSYADVYELANHMIGELNASHVGVSGPSGRPSYMGRPARYLGFEMEPAEGRYRISHLYRDGPATREWLRLNVGDFVLALNGTELAAGDNYWKLLNEAVNEYVTVRVARTAGGGEARDVRIRTLASITDLKYEDWVTRNREFVEKVSDGAIAYVHIRAMNAPALERFQNEINRYWNSHGIVVDIRYNGGGNIDQQLLDILARRPYQYWNSRYGARTWGRRPRQAIAGPKVLLTNALSGSNSEVTPMGFRQLGIGRIVGNPTMAAVIATGSYPLINGGTIRTPGSLVVTYDPTRPHNYGINLENYGVAPDVMVENTPEDELRGFDRELNTAVDEAMKMLREGRWQYQP